MMKPQIFLLLVVGFLITPFCLSAKEGKIKLTKLISYQGEISEKSPIGNGSLYIKLTNSKNENFAVISGHFQTITAISNSSMQSACLPTFQIKGNATFSYSHTKGQEESFCIEYSQPTTLINDRDTLICNSLLMNTNLEDGRWITLFKTTPLIWMTENWKDTDYYTNIVKLGAEGKIIAEKKSIEIPQPLLNRQWSVSHILTHSIPDSLHFYQNLIYVLDPQCESVYNDHTGQFMNVKSGLSFISKNNHTWSGYRVLSDDKNVTIIYKKSFLNDEVEIKEYSTTAFKKICALNNKIQQHKKVQQSESLFSLESFSLEDLSALRVYKWEQVPALRIYRGTIKNCNNVADGTFTQQDIHYLTGEYIERSEDNSVTKRILWRDGETESQLKDRLVVGGITDTELLTEVMKGSMTESHALTEQKNRNKWKEYRDRGNIPPVQILTTLEDYIKSQPNLLGTYKNDWNTVSKLCSDNPEILFHHSQDALDLEIYRQSSQYSNDKNKYATCKNNIYLFRIPIGNVDVDGKSFTITIRRG